jgi:hypothetical protein
MKPIPFLLIVIAAFAGWMAFNYQRQLQKQSEAQSESHRAALESCEAETFKADKAVFAPDSVVVGINDTRERRLNNHKYRLADCLAHDEHTTIDYQWKRCNRGILHEGNRFSRIPAKPLGRLGFL